MIDARLREFATQRQAEIIDAVLKHGSNGRAAKALGVSRIRVEKTLSAARKRAAKAGYSPEHAMTHTVPEGFHAKGVSTLYDGAGNVKAQWVKSQRDREYEHEVLVEAIQTIAEPFAGKSDAPKCEAKQHDTNQLACYVIGDHHFGMLSWRDETGEDYDLKIAETLLVEAVDKLVATAPATETALIVSLGDLLHFDGYEAITQQSGHHLDTDSRWPKIVRCVVRAIRRAIETALTKHKRVRLVLQQGNHDTRSSMMLAIALAEYYSNDPRVEVDDSPAYFHYHRFGKNLIGITHGDRAKAQNMPGIMAADRPKDWGETEHRFAWTGHVHHRSVLEGYGCHVETFGVLAAKDAWHHGQGYRAARSMTCVVLDKEYGEVTRHTVGVPQLMRRAAS